MRKRTPKQRRARKKKSQKSQLTHAHLAQSTSLLDSSKSHNSAPVALEHSETPKPLKLLLGRLIFTLLVMVSPSYQELLAFSEFLESSDQALQSLKKKKSRRRMLTPRRKKPKSEIRALL